MLEKVLDKVPDHIAEEQHNVVEDVTLLCSQNNVNNQIYPETDLLIEVFK